MIQIQPAVCFGKRLSAVVVGLLVVTQCVALPTLVQGYDDTVVEVPGSLAGRSDVSASGSVNYQIELPLPPGTAGMKPELSLVYDSQGVFGPVGIGWRLAGLSVVTRGSQNLVDDGVVAGVMLSPADALFLDGRRLIPIETRGNQIEYRQRIDNGSRIVASLADNGHPTSFVVESRAGLAMEFGASPDSRLMSAEGIPLLWACSAIRDTCGNYIEFKYRTNGRGDHAVSSIAYTGNSAQTLAPYVQVDFDYQQFAPPVGAYSAGLAIERDSLLSAIRVRDHGILVREYRFAYSAAQSAGRFVLSSVQQVGSDGTVLRPTRFSYSRPRAGWDVAPEYVTPVPFSTDAIDATGLRALDVSGDGRADLLFASRTQDDFRSWAYVATDTGWTETPAHRPPVPFSVGGAPEPAVTLVDVDADARLDLVFAPDPARGNGETYLNRPEGWIADPRWRLPVPLEVQGNANSAAIFLDFNADGRRDLIWSFVGADGQVQTGAVRNTTQGWVNDATAIPPAHTSAGVNGEPAVLVADVNADRLPDLTFRRRTSTGLEPTAVYLRTNAGWTPTANPAFGLPLDQKVDSRAVQTIDLNADGVEDVLVGWSDAGSTIRAAYISSPGGWEEREQHQSPFSFYDPRYGRTGVASGDLDGDGRLDLLARSRLATDIQFSGAYRNTPNGWVAVAGLVPPAFLLDRTAGPIVAFLDRFTSDGRFDLVYAFTPKGAGLYVNSVDHWDLAVSLAPPLPLAAKDVQDLGVRMSDLNGDGFVDLIWGNEDTGQSGAAINTGEGWIDSPAFAPPLAFVRKGSVDSGIRLIDVTGDGLTDFLINFETLSGAKEVAAFANTGSGWQRDDRFAPPLQLQSARAGSQGAEFVDLNGDGLTDILFSRRDLAGKDDAGAFLNTGSGWQNAPQFKPPCLLQVNVQGQDGRPVAVDLGCIIGDQTGDRLPDLLFRYKVPKGDGAEASSMVRNTGSGWTTVASYAPPVLLTSSTDEEQIIAQSHDVNGDGLPDLLYTFRKQDKSIRTESYLATGTSWVRRPEWDLPHAAIGAGRGDPGYRFIDISGDGVVDVVYSRVDEDEQQRSGAFVNSGSGWSSSPDFSIPLPVARHGQGDTGTRLFDVNGDGLPDLVTHRKTGDTAEQGVYVNRTATRSDLLVEVVDGLGLRTTYGYRALCQLSPGDRSQLADRSQYPHVITNPALYVAASIETAHLDGSLQRMSTRYGPLTVNIRSGRTLGFTWRESINEITGVSTLSQFLIDDIAIGHVKSQATRFGPQVLSKTDSEWRISQTVDGPAPAKAWRIDLAAQTTESFDLDGSPRTSTAISYEYDALGNVTRLTTTIPGETTTLVESTYEDDLDKWHLGRLTHAVTTRSAPGSPLLVREVAYEYDTATGLLVTEVADPQLNEGVRKRHRYDAFGNRIESRVSATDIHTRITRTEYDAEGRFPTRATNEAGHVAITEYDPVAAAVAITTDPNGRMIRFSYDGHGRQTSLTDPEGIVTSTTYGFATAELNLPAAAYKVTVTTGSLPPQTTVFDDIRRTIRTITPGFQGRLINSDTEFDASGRTSRTSLPYFASDEPLWTSMEYDVLDRPLRIVGADQEVRTFHYAGRMVTATDAAGRTTASSYNQRGLLVDATDASGGRIELTYDPADHPLAVLRGDGRRVQMAYDVRGRRISLDDPNSGRWQYQYDSLGQLILQTDPKQHDTAFEYDLLGRVTRKDQFDQQIRWSYDTAAHGVGQVACTWSNCGYREDFAYDAQGRPSRSTVCTAEGYFTQSTTYDEYGRVDRTTFPSGLTIRNEYDASGALAAVIDVHTGGAFWRLHATDAAGHVRGEGFGNRIRAVHDYSNETGLRTADALYSRHEQVLDSRGYEYDVMGNLVRTKRPNETEEFEYDDLDRLVRHCVEGRLPVTVRYDAIGRIREKSDVGLYSYGGDVADGVTTIVNRLGGMLCYSYDACGAAINGPHHWATYTGDHNVRSLRNTASSREFHYTPDGRCFREVTCEGNLEVTTLRLGLYEEIRECCDAKRRDTSVLRQRHYIPGAGGVVAVVDCCAESVTSGRRRRRFNSYSARTTRYLHRDRLGTITAISDESGQLCSTYQYDPWGKLVAWSGESILDVGHTGHRRLDAFQLTNMNGRLFDPCAAVFMHADTGATVPGRPQDTNTFAYAAHNPLKYIDPSGHFFLFDIILAPFRLAFEIGKLVVSAVIEVGKFLVENWREIISIGAAIVVGVLAAPLGPVVAGALAGAAYGGLNTALHGGSLGDIIKATLIGAASGALFGFIGGELASAGANFAETAFVQGVTGGIITGAQGGDPLRGFLSGAFSGFGTQLSAFVPATQGILARAAVAALVGGTAALIGGGKFANGAAFGAFAFVMSVAAQDALRGPGRGLTDAEKELLKNHPVLKDIDTSKVQLYPRRFGLQDKMFALAMSPEGNAYLGTRGAEVPAFLGDKSLFIHEMTHVWQHQHGINVWWEGVKVHTGMGTPQSISVNGQVFTDIESQAYHYQKRY